MRARTAEPLLLALAFAGLAPATHSQEGGGTEKEPVDPRRRSQLEVTDEEQKLVPPMEAAEENDAGALLSTDSLGWQALANDLFVSGESGFSNPSRVEPDPRRAFKFGPVDLLPKWDEELMYDDNVFLTEDDEEDDLVLRSRFGLLTDWAIGSTGHRVTAGYDMLRNWFSGGESKNFVEQFASAQLELNFRHLRMTIGDRWEDRTDPVLSVFTGKIERTINTPHATVGWYEDSPYWEGRVHRVSTAYEDAAFEAFDRDEDLAFVEYGWLSQEEMWFFVRGSFIDRLFDEDGLNDMVGGTVSGGVRYRRGPEFDGSARIGLRYETFDDDFGSEDDTVIHPEVEARGYWWATRIDALDGRYLHTTEFSPVSNYEILDRAELGLTRLFTPRVRGRFGVGLEHVNPSDVSDTFWRYIAGAGVTWRLRDFVDLTANWRVRIRKTDEPNGDYTGNQISIGFAVRL